MPWSCQDFVNYTVAVHLLELEDLLQLGSFWFWLCSGAPARQKYFSEALYLRKFCYPSI